MNTMVSMMPSTWDEYFAHLDASMAARETLIETIDHNDDEFDLALDAIAVDTATLGAPTASDLVRAHTFELAMERQTQRLQEAMESVRCDLERVERQLQRQMTRSVVGINAGSFEARA